MTRKARSTPGNRIRSRRLAMGLTQAQLAKRCGVNSSFISLLELGRSKASVDRLFQIAKILCVSPGWIQRGELSLEEQARAARLELWPEIAYLVANHCVIPRLLDLEPVLAKSESLHSIFQRAWSCWHFCEFRLWAISKDGRRTAAEIAGRGLIEQLIKTIPRLNWHPDEAWKRLTDVSSFALFDLKGHYSIPGVHSPKYPCDCFEYDITATDALWEDLFFSSGGGYGTRPFRAAFVQRAFPQVFWSAAQRWSDKRLAGWFWYLGIPTDLFGPLVTIARAHADPEGFSAAGLRLLNQASIPDMDAFLGLFVDIYSGQDFYRERFGERPFGGPAVFAGLLDEGFGLPRARRLARASMRDQLRLDFIHLEAPDALKAEVAEFLAKKAEEAGPNQFTDDDVLAADHGGKPFPRDPRLEQEPPETLV